MSKLNNPVGRLHVLLTAFEAAAGPSVTINDAWCKVLDVGYPDLLPSLGQVAGLLNDVRVAVERSDRPELKNVYDTFSRDWAVPIFAHGRNPSSEGSIGLVDARALASLGSLAVTFEIVAAAGVIPEEDVEAEVRAGFVDLLDQLMSDTSLPREMQAAISARVHDILWAMDHVQIVGPEGVAAAIERLVGRLAIFAGDAPDVTEDGLFQRTMKAASRAWRAFRTPGDVHQAIEGWHKLYELLPPN